MQPIDRVPPATRPSRPGDALQAPIPRRRMLLLLGAGVLATGSGLGVLLGACAPVAPVAVTLQLNPATMPTGVPVEVPFSMTNAGGSTVQSSVWLLKNADGTLIAYDPRCTHALCQVKWAAAESKFKCNCHGGEFALDGSVLSGPPPKPLNRFPLTSEGGVVTVDVPGDFAAPRESLGA
jgi:nitrite reductase/ring-hydroxylating ferredoxin subunit